eukprot:5230997-Amphidinium_carterae.1
MTNTTQRWGSTLDLFLLAELYGLPLRAIDLTTGRVIAQRGEQSKFKAIVAWRQHHFFLQKKKKHRRNRKQ